MEFLYDHPEISETAPVVGSPDVSNDVLSVSVFGAEEVQLRYCTGDIASHFQSVTMVDDGTQGDAYALDGIYSVGLPSFSSDNIKFYVSATNSEAMSLSPQRAEYEYYLYGTGTGIDDDLFQANTTASDWSIAPNPASNWFSLQHCEPLAPITIFDPQGRMKMQHHWDGIPVDISGWSPGVYLVQVKEAHSLSTKRLLVR